MVVLEVNVNSNLGSNVMVPVTVNGEQLGDKLDLLSIVLEWAMTILENGQI